MPSVWLRSRRPGRSVPALRVRGLGVHTRADRAGAARPARPPRRGKARYPNRPLPRGRLAVAPGGRALLEEGAHPFLRIGRESVLGHDLARMVVRAVLVALDLRVEGPLPEGDRVGACFGDPLDERIDG